MLHDQNVKGDRLKTVKESNKISTIPVSISLCFYPSWPIILLILNSHQPNTILREKNAVANIVFSRSLLHFFQLSEDGSLMGIAGPHVLQRGDRSTTGTGGESTALPSLRSETRSPDTHIHLCISQVWTIGTIQGVNYNTCCQSQVQFIQGANHRYDTKGEPLVLRVNHYYI